MVNKSLNDIEEIAFNLRGIKYLIGHTKIDDNDWECLVDALNDYSSRLCMIVSDLRPNMPEPETCNNGSDEKEKLPATA